MMEVNLGNNQLKAVAADICSIGELAHVNLSTSVCALSLCCACALTLLSAFAVCACCVCLLSVFAVCVCFVYDVKSIVVLRQATVD